MSMLFTPYQLGPLALANRIARAVAAAGMAWPAVPPPTRRTSIAISAPPARASRG